MSDWLLNLPVLWMALIIFGLTFLMAAAIYVVITRLAVGERAVAFKAISPGMLPSLGIIFGLLVGFTASQVWNDFEKAKLAVANEASALRTVMLLGQRLSPDDDTKPRTLIHDHINAAVNEEWPAMASWQATLVTLQSHLSDALKMTLAICLQMKDSEPHNMRLSRRWRPRSRRADSASSSANRRSVRSNGLG